MPFILLHFSVSKFELNPSENPFRSNTDVLISARKGLTADGRSVEFLPFTGKTNVMLNLSIKCFAIPSEDEQIEKKKNQKNEQISVNNRRTLFLLNAYCTANMQLNSSQNTCHFTFKKKCKELTYFPGIFKSGNLLL